MDPPETNLVIFLPVLGIKFQLSERRQWLTTWLTGPSRTKFFITSAAVKLLSG